MDVLYILWCNASVIGKLEAYKKWNSLVKDGARWDFKDAIFTKFDGDPIKLGDQWFEYSTPGNILYGFTGASAGFSRFELHGGASYAQVMDDLASDDPKDNVGPILPSFLDQVSDYYAVDFGYKLFETYGRDVTQVEFKVFLANYEHRDSLAVEPPPSNYRPPPSDWPYEPGTFDNPASK